jgi:hypothetical protein
VSRVLLRPKTLRILTPVLAMVFLAVALAFRAATDGVVQNATGTALYASMVYVAIVFFWPRMRPFLAGAIAIAFCWAVEVSQLTGVPAYLSARSIIARLVLGVSFDPWDLAWYPVGVIPLVAIHWFLRRTPAVATPRSRQDHV